MLEIKNWMEEHKTNQLPRSQYKDRNGKNGSMSSFWTLFLRIFLFS